MQITKSQFISGSFWKILERFFAKGISMIVSVILSRLLMPSDYGLIALTAVFTNFSDILIDAGFSTALIRKEDADEYDYGSAFTISFVIAAVLYAIFYFLAPYAAGYYDEPRLAVLLRVMSLIVFVQAFSSTRNAVVNRNMQFKLLMKCSMASAAISGAAGIGAALSGMGVWALVIQRLLSQVLLTLFLMSGVKWRIKYKMKWERVKEFLGFSSGVAGSSLLNYFGGSLYGIVIAKGYSVSDLGFYDKGSQLPEQMSLNIFGSMTSVLLPTAASYQNDIEKMRSVISKVVKTTGFFLIPMMTGLAAAAPEMITVLFTGKWAFSIPVMKNFCIYYMAVPFMLIDIQVFFALGHSGLRVKAECIRLFLTIAALLTGSFVFHCSISTLSAVNAFLSVIMAFITAFEVKKEIGYGIRQRVRDICEPAFISAVMGIVITVCEKELLVHIPLQSAGLLFAKVLLGMAVYVIGCIALRNEIFLEIWQVLAGCVRKLKRFHHYE